MRARRTMTGRIVGLAGLVGVLALTIPIGAASAQERFDEVWAGGEDGTGARASVWWSGERFVLVDSAGVTMGRATFAPHGPGAKGSGALTFRGEVATTAVLDHAGKSRVSVRSRGRTGGVVKLTFRIDGDAVRLCATDPTLAAPGYPSVAPKAVHAPGTRCYTLTRIAAVEPAGDPAAERRRRGKPADGLPAND